MLFQLYPSVKVKFIGEDEITEEDLANWKAERKEKLKAQEEARRQAAMAKELPVPDDEEAVVDGQEEDA